MINTKALIADSESRDVSNFLQNIREQAGICFQSSPAPFPTTAVLVSPERRSGGRLRMGWERATKREGQGQGNANDREQGQERREGEEEEEHPFHDLHLSFAASLY